MKRFLALCLCAAALAAFASQSACASFNVSLNLYPVDPLNLSLGGNWVFVAKTNTPGSQGISAIVWRLSNFDPSGAESPHPSVGHEINGGALQTGVFGGATEFVYGQNPLIGIPPLIFGVGTAASPSLLPIDPFGEVGWDNTSIIATGTVSTLAVLPAFTLVAANEYIGGLPTSSTVGLTRIRVFTGIPEPATAVLAMLAFGVPLLRRRR